MRWPWTRDPKIDPAAVRALEQAHRARDEVVDQWHPVLEVAEEHRALQGRNHFRERVVFAMALQPEVKHSVMMNRRRDDPK